MDFFFWLLFVVLTGIRHFLRSQLLQFLLLLAPTTSLLPLSTQLGSLENSRSPFHLEISYDRRFSAELRRKPSAAAQSGSVVAAKRPEPLKIMISRAPASCKGIQCEFIKKRYGLVHIAAGDLLN